MNYDIYYENMIQRLFENKKDYKELNKQLKNIYDETQYMGTLYYMAKSYYHMNDEDQAIDLFCESAKAGDVRSIEILAEYFLNKIASYLFASQMWCKKGLEYEDSVLYNQDFSYLLAKNNMIEAITYDRSQQYEESLEKIKELADNNYLPAINLLKLIKNDIL